MVARVGKVANDFTATWVMEDDSFRTMSLKEAANGRYVCLFFYPLDFTFVCPSEILAFNEKVEEFKAKGCALFACSVDSHFSHLAWKNTPIEKGGIGHVQIPLISDLKKTIMEEYGVAGDGVAYRGLFIMDKDLVIRHMLINDLPLGRNVDEALRVLDALQFTEKHGEVCPANWRPGKKSMKPSAEGVANYLKDAYSASS